MGIKELVQKAYENASRKGFWEDWERIKVDNINMAKHFRVFNEIIAKRSIKMGNLKKALYTLLYDQFDSVDLEITDSDETYVDYIVNALLEKNKIVCPFKNYDCVQNCKSCTGKCNEDELSIECGEEPNKVWREFIGIEI